MSEEPRGNVTDPGTEIAIVDERSIRDKIYIVRGVKVMLDFELAAIYGYETKNFNRQIRNNAARFEGDAFMFQLTREEYDAILRCKNFTSSWGGTRYLPYVFTEQCIYMLMTVLRGELAIRQSRALVMAFKAMKDYIVENQGLLTRHDYLRLSMQMSDTQQSVHAIQTQLMEHEDRLNTVFTQMSDTVRKSEISPFMLDLAKKADEDHPKEFLILNGQPAKADETYISIYSQAKHSIFIIDNYLSIKTLRLLHGAQAGVTVTIFSDNLGNQLHAHDYADFQTEFPSIPVSFRQTSRTTHDRFIVLDYGTGDEKVFHCGASSKDAGIRLTTVISELTDKQLLIGFRGLVKKLMANPVLTLR